MVSSLGWWAPFISAGAVDVRVAPHFCFLALLRKREQYAFIDASQRLPASRGSSSETPSFSKESVAFHLNDM
jgi:hypothetical protein